MTYTPPPQSIKTWAVRDRPREKMVANGQQALSDAELIAILIGSGTRRKSAVDLAREILNYVDNSLSHLGRLNIEDLCRFSGIGKAKAVTIAAALEIGRRRMIEATPQKPKIRSAGDAFKAIRYHFQNLNHEEFFVFLLNRANRITNFKRISMGGTSGTFVDPKLIFKYAITHYASGIIVAHNHPSGQLKPSDSDIRITDRIAATGKVLEIPLLDHLIITDENYYSFNDNGLLKSK